jgi:predicted transcriptional regulator
MDIKSINIFNSGIEKSLGSLETAIMEYLWNQKDPQSARQVTDAIAQKNKVSFNAVSTVLNRLEAKKLLQKVAKGKRYSFTPTTTKKEYSYAIFKNGLKSLLGDKSLLSAAGITSDASDEKIDPQTAKLLAEFLHQNENKQ